MQKVILFFLVIYGIQASANKCVNSLMYSHPAVLKLVADTQKKIELITELGRILNLPLHEATDWDFKYLYGKSKLGTNLNLEVEILTHDI